MERGQGGEPDGGTVRVGVLSDTHGLLRPEVLRAFRGVARILHAGDVGDPAILTELEALAPVTAVWGNVDGWAVRDRTAEEAEGEVAGLRYAVTHGHQVMPRYGRLAARFPGAGLVVYGHTHVPALRRAGGTLLLNPGSAGPRRAGRPVSVAVVEIRPGAPPGVTHLDLESGRPFLP